MEDNPSAMLSLIDVSTSHPSLELKGEIQKSKISLNKSGIKSVKKMTNAYTTKLIGTNNHQFNTI